MRIKSGVDALPYLQKSSPVKKSLLTIIAEPLFWVGLPMSLIQGIMIGRFIQNGLTF